MDYIDFEKKGYVILKKIFTEKEIKNLRKTIFTEFNVKKRRAAGEHAIFTSELIKNSQVSNLFFSDNLIKRLVKIFGKNFILYNQMCLLINSNSPFWHRDSQSQSETYIFDSSYYVSKVILYLQKNSLQYGGGLQVRESSHKPIFGLSNLSKKITINNPRLERVRNFFLKKQTVDFEIGDILIMHANLWHRASPTNFEKYGQICKFGLKNVPKDSYKLMIDWEVSKNNILARKYANHQISRSKEGGLFADLKNLGSNLISSKAKSNFAKKNHFQILNIK